MSTFHPLVQQGDLRDGMRRAFTVGGVQLLLIQEAGRAYLIENKCGHFGVPLETGRVDGSTIRCSMHGIVFDMTDGRVVKSGHDDCEPLRVFSLTGQDGWLGVLL